MNLYVIIENHIYYFGSDGAMKKSGTQDGNSFASDGSLKGNKTTVTVSGNTYYLVNNQISVNLYVIIENHIYYFGSDGAMKKSGTQDGNSFASDGSLKGNKTTVTVNGNTYYLVNNQISVNLYVIIENHIYYFGSDGAMFKNKTHDGYQFNANGQLIGDKMTVTVNGKTYYLVNNQIPAVTYGDINGDGAIDVFDYQMLKASVLGTFKDVTDKQKEAMDVNHDGCADAFDYQMLKAHVLGTYVIQ